jgi:hypothetical protein
MMGFDDFSFLVGREMFNLYFFALDRFDFCVDCPLRLVIREMNLIGLS